MAATDSGSFDPIEAIPAATCPHCGGATKIASDLATCGECGWMDAA